MTIMNMSEEIEIRQNNVQKTIATTYKRRWGDRADGRRLRQGNHWRNDPHSPQ